MRRAPRVPAHLRLILERNTHPRALLRALRSLGNCHVAVTVLGYGEFRTAYRVSWFDGRQREFVVKQRQDLRPGGVTGTLGRRLTRSSRVRYAPTAQVGKWDVQHFYIPIPDNYPGFGWLFNLRGDIKLDNCGLERDGTVVCFDW